MTDVSVVPFAQAAFPSRARDRGDRVWLTISVISRISPRRSPVAKHSRAGQNRSGDGRCPITHQLSHIAPSPGSP